MRPTPHQLLVREMILQLKTGQLDAGYFRDKFGVDILDDWRDAWQQYQDEGYLDFRRRAGDADARRPAARRRAAARLLRRDIAACAIPKSLSHDPGPAVADQADLGLALDAVRVGHRRNRVGHGGRGAALSRHARFLRRRRQRIFLLHCPFVRGASAMALGHVVLAQTTNDLAHSYAHELVHVRQYERWGPLFVPAYVAAAAWQVTHGRHPYWDNPFEREAFDATG